jgi:hypothetical protein
MGTDGSSPVTRRGFLRGAAKVSAAAVTARGVYAALDDFAAPERAAAAVVARKQEHETARRR